MARPGRVAAGSMRCNRLVSCHIFRGNVLKVAAAPYEPLPESRQRIMEDLDYQL